MNQSTRQTAGRAAGDHTVFLGDPVQDALLSMVMALTAELSVVRDRLDAHERLLGGTGLPVAPHEVDAFVPDAEAREQRQAVRRRILRHVMRVINERLPPEALGAQTSTYQSILDEVRREPAA
jgi:uncharacterized protein (DUF2267 family)